MPGDQIGLRIHREPELSGTYRIDERGESVLPILGVVRVVDKPISELQDSLRQAYSQYLRNPAVEVTVLRRIGVQGAVEKPNLYMIDLTMTLRDAIALAGGVTPEGDPRRITLVRADRRIPLPNGPSDSFPTAELRSGDQIIVGQRSWLARNSLQVVTTAAFLASALVPLIRNLADGDGAAAAGSL